MEVKQPINIQPDTVLLFNITHFLTLRKHTVSNKTTKWLQLYTQTTKWLQLYTQTIDTHDGPITTEHQ